MQINNIFSKTADQTIIQDYDYFANTIELERSKSTGSTLKSLVGNNIEYKDDKGGGSNTLPVSSRLASIDISQVNSRIFLSQKKLGDLVRQSIKHSKTLYPTSLVSTIEKLHTGPITQMKVSGDYLSIVTSG